VRSAPAARAHRGVAGRGEKGSVIPFWSSPRSRRWQKGGSSSVLAVVETMALGKLGSKWEREKRVSGVAWRSRAARGAFCRASEGELRRQKGGGYRRNDR
jgi:hypothetical protein